MQTMAMLLAHLFGDYVFQDEAMAERKTSNDFVCIIHCLIYAACVGVFCHWFLSFWAVLMVGLLHFPVDRYRLAKYLLRFSYRNGMWTENPFAPVSLIVIDNTIHLLVLYLAAIMSA